MFLVMMQTLWFLTEILIKYDGRQIKSKDLLTFKQTEVIFCSCIQLLLNTIISKLKECHKRNVISMLGNGYAVPVPQYLSFITPTCNGYLIIYDKYFMVIVSYRYKPSTKTYFREPSSSLVVPYVRCLHHATLHWRLIYSSHRYKIFLWDERPSLWYWILLLGVVCLTFKRHDDWVCRQNIFLFHQKNIFRWPHSLHTMSGGDTSVSSRRSKIRDGQQTNTNFFIRSHVERDPVKTLAAVCSRHSERRSINSLVPVSSFTSSPLGPAVIELRFGSNYRLLSVIQRNVWLIVTSIVSLTFTASHSWNSVGSSLAILAE